MVDFVPGNKPKVDELLPLKEAYWQIADWFRVTPEEVRKRFEEGGLTGSFGNVAVPTNIKINPLLQNEAEIMGLQCYVLGEKGGELITKNVFRTLETFLVENARAPAKDKKVKKSPVVL